MKIEIKITGLPTPVFFGWDRRFKIRNYIFSVLQGIHSVIPWTSAIKYEEVLEEGEEAYESEVVEVEWPLP
jgi:hypothetical protein